MDVKINDMFLPDDRLRSLIDENHHLILVMCRSGLSLGYGDKTVAQVCEEDGADCDTFLAISNFVSGKPHGRYNISLPALMAYLEHTHSYFLDFMLPSIRRKLIESINGTETDHDVAFLLLQFFDGYVDEVRHHMDYENRTIFEYVKSLLDGRPQPGFRISDYSEGHGNMVEKLNELKDLFVRHYHRKSNDTLNSALFDIITCEQDLMSHCDIENRLFIPAVEKLERSVTPVGDADGEADASASVESLTEREKEIIRCVARGLANKEIADELRLSIHTVTTYRRNISAKLRIHSTAGITIFAILHKLIDLNEVR